MKLPINIEELLGGKAVENDRIEYKTGWNPDAIYRSICAFANDFDETGIPIIQDELKANGSPKATIETDEERTYFLIDIPCHPEFIKEKVVLNKDFTKDFIKDFIKEKSSQVSERQEKILFMIANDETLTSQKIAQKTGVTQRTILSDLNKLQTMGILARDGGRKDGSWVILTT